MTTRRYQQVRATLSDGRVGYFMGPELVTDKDVEAGLSATFEFIRSKPLPPGMGFEKLEEESGSAGVEDSG